MGFHGIKALQLYVKFNVTCFLHKTLHICISHLRQLLDLGGHVFDNRCVEICTDNSPISQISSQEVSSC